MDHDGRSFIPGMQGWLTIQKSAKAIYHMNRSQRKVVISKGGKSISQNLLTSVPNKNYKWKGNFST